MEVSQEFTASSKHSAGWLQMTTTELTTYVLVSFIMVLWCYFKWKQRPFEKVASKLNGPPSYPIIGSTLKCIGTHQQISDNIIEQLNSYGCEPFKVWIGPYFSVAISKPEDLQIILNSSKALDKSKFYNFFKNSVGEGLTSAPVHKWRKHRRLITPVFNANLLDQFFPVFNEKNQILVKNLKKELGKTQPFDLLDYIVKTNLDIICQTAMGYKLDIQLNKKSEFAEALIKVAELDCLRIYKPWLYSDIIFSIYRRLMGLQNIYKTFHKLPNEVIREMKETRAQRKMENKNNTTDVNDGDKKPFKMFLDTLFDLNEAGEDFSDEQIRDEVVTMLIGGSETNTVTVCFCLLMLAIHPEYQDKVYDEIFEVLGDVDQTITIEDTVKLVYLEQCIRETLRLYPTVPVFLRQLQDDVKIFSDDLTLPKGTICFISPLTTHHISELYPSPWSFNPDNFDAENVNKRHKYSFIAFSGGPRGCIGSKYAMLSMKVLVSTFLRNYSVHTDIKLSDIKLKIDVILRSSNGYPVTIRQRDRRPTYKKK